MRRLGEAGMQGRIGSLAAGAAGVALSVAACSVGGGDSAAVTVAPQPAQGTTLTNPNPSASLAAAEPGGPPTASAGEQAGVRTAPVVPGRRARVFILAAVGDACEPLAITDLRVAAAPAKGDVSFEPGQPTKIATSATGTCIGTKTAGTGIYYTARAGAAGEDAFSVSATLPTGEVATRSFKVQVTP